jgi:hypothetical protein
MIALSLRLVPHATLQYHLTIVHAPTSISVRSNLAIAHNTRRISGVHFISRSRYPLFIFMAPRSVRRHSSVAIHLLSCFDDDL